MISLARRTYFITGASRGIGKAIALKLAKAGANIAVAAKSTEENPKLGGTIYSAAEEIEAAGGQALAVHCDIRDDQMIEQAVQQTVEKIRGNRWRDQQCLGHLFKHHRQNGAKAL